MKDGIVGAYQKKTGLEANVISAMMDEERWLKAEEAQALGFVDVIEEGVEAAASVGEWRVRFDKFAKAKMQDTPISEVELSEPATDPVIEETPVAAEVAESVTDAPVVEEQAQEAEKPKTERDPNAGVTPIIDALAKIEELTAEITSLKEQLAAPVESASPVAKADHEFAAALLQVSADRDTFKAQLDEAKANEIVAKAEASDLREQMKAKDVLHDALKRSLGIAAAVEAPAVPAGEPINLIEQLNKLSGADRTEFFRKHRAEIIKQNKH
jgi:hypothetical protein